MVYFSHFLKKALRGRGLKSLEEVDVIAVGNKGIILEN